MWLGLWWSEPALVIEWVLLFALWLPVPCQGLDLFPSCWSGSPQIFSELQCQADANRALPLGEEPECFSARAVHQRVCSAVSPVTRCADTQGTPLLAPSVGPISTLECQQLALVSLNCCFHKSTITDPLKSCPGTVVVEHLDPLWELLRQFRLWPSPAPMHMPCGSPHCPLGCWIYKAGIGSVNLQPSGRDFSPAFQVMWLLGLTCGFSPTSVSGQPIGICSQSWLRWQLGCESPQRQECPPQWWLRQVLGGSTLWQGLVLEKRGYNGSPSPPFTHLLIMVLCFRSGSGFLLWTPLAVAYTLQPLLAVSAQPIAVLSLGLSSKPWVPAPSPGLYQMDTPISSWGLQGGGRDHLYRSLSVLPTANQLLLSPLKLPVYIDHSPCQWEGFSGYRNISSFSIVSQGCRSYPSSCFFFPFILPDCVEIFVFLSNVRGLLLVSVGVLWELFHL